jgi:SpoVK/Ycf46/Vps4 family AAA+-type ATPase
MARITNFNLIGIDLVEQTNSSTIEQPIRAKNMTEEDGYNEETLKQAQMWACFNGRYTACERAVKQLSPGQYNIQPTDAGVVFVEHKVNTDRLLNLPDSASEEIIKDIEVFWKKEKHFRKLQFLWKRGILLYGAPGGGKTCCVQQVSERIVNKGGISFYVDDPGLGAVGLELFRRIEPTRPILVMLEDLDAIVNRHGESSLLALLDGELQIDNVVFIATTNYPEMLDKRIINRPSRFDIIKQIDMPSPEARAMYLTEVNPRLKRRQKELNTWVEMTKGYSIAHLKELVVGIEVFEVSLEDTITRLNNMIDVQVTSDDDEKRQTFGFKSS